MDEVRLKADLTKTLWNAWFECGDKPFPETFPDRVEELVSELVRKASHGRIALSEAYSTARKLGIESHVSFYSLE